MRLLVLGQRPEEQPRLAVVIGEQFGADAQLVALLVLGRLWAKVVKPVTGHSRGPPPRLLGQAVGLVVGAALGHVHLHLPVALEIHHRTFRRVDRQLMEIGGAEPRLLRVEIAEQPPLQQRIVGEVDARHDVGRAIGDLLGLGEEIVGLRSSTMRPISRTGSTSSGMSLVASSTS